MPRPYKGSDSEMLTIAENGWYHCQQLQSLFEAADSTYTPLYITNQIAKVQTARDMLPLRARTELRKNLHVAMEQDLAKIIVMIKLFKNYISNAITNRNSRKTATDAMGYNLLPKAKNKNWKVVRTMLVSANNYGIANSAMLLATGGMPPNFLTDLATLTATFDTHYSDFLAQSSSTLVATETRNLALKKIHATLMKMFSLAQLLNITPATKEQFNYSHQLKTISSKPTGIKGYIYESATGKPVAGVKVEIPSKGIVVFTAADGSYKIMIEHGQYSIKITPPSLGPAYIVINDTIIVTVSTMSNRDFFLY